MVINVSRNRVVAVFAVAIAIAIFAWSSSSREVFGEAEAKMKKAGPANYTVVMTEGHNLLVTDNGTNKLYFYTIDKDKPIGSPLKLRASVNLTKVGQEEIKITPHNVEKLEKTEKPE